MNLEKELNKFIRKYGENVLFNLARHYNKSGSNWVNHSMKKIERFRECPLCDKYMEMGNLQSHIKAKHPNENISLNKSIKLLMGDR